MKRWNRRIRLIPILALTLIGGASCAHAPRTLFTSASGDHVRVRMIADAEELIPGATHRIGVLFEMDPGWHLYGPTRNDSGLPVLLEPSASEGFSLGEPLWPTPHRLLSEGPVLDHVYEDRVTAILPLAVPPDARPGESVKLQCRASWLVCGTGCIPGEGVVEIILPIGRSGVPRASSDARFIHAAEGRLPMPLAPSASSDWGREDWTIRVPGAAALTFYPFETCAPLVDIIGDAVSKTDRLRLRLEPDGPADSRITGILEVATSNTPRFYSIDSHRPPVGAGESTDKNGSQR